MNKQQMHALLSIVEKIDVLKGLTADEVERLLQLCNYTAYEAGTELFKVGNPSEDMFIVLQGKLVPRSRNGTVLGDIRAGSCCGEMGLFTGAPRTATVTAEEPTTGFRISRADLQLLFRTDLRVHIKILQNIVSLLSRRLATTGNTIEEYALRTAQLEDQLGLGSESDEAEIDENTEERDAEDEESEEEST
jgi:CRP-like cAMP-binding protein